MKPQEVEKIVEVLRKIGIEDHIPAILQVIKHEVTALEQSVREDEQQKTLAILKKINEGSKKVSLEISRLKEEVAALTLAAKIPRGE